MTINHRVSRRFTRLTDASLNIFAGSTVVNMTNNPLFSDPLIPLSQIADLQKAFHESSVACYEGGRVDTARKSACREGLLTALRSQAGYVEHVCRDNLAGLLSSGFINTNPNRAPSPLATPAILQVLNERSAALTLRLTPVANARNYQVQIQAGEGGWEEAGTFSKARRIEVENLTPGTVYRFRARALGGSTGYSDWSQVVSRMSL